MDRASEPASLSARAKLELRGLKVHFPTGHGPVRAVDGVDLSVPAGSTLALVGESGCGKSTLAKAVMGLVAPSAGEILLDSSKMPALGTSARRALCRKIQMVFQDPEASLNPRLTLAASVEEPLRLHTSLGRGARLERLQSLFVQVGLEPALLQRYPHELSGGQRQRVCIARALAVEPDVLVCDEAVSALDVSVQAQIVNLLRDLQSQLGLTYLFITHDLAIVRQIADRVAVMYLGQVVELGSTDRVLDAPEHPYTQALLSAVPTVTAGARRRPSHPLGEVPSPLSPPAGCRFHTRCARAFERCATQAPPEVPLPDGLSRCWLSQS